MQTMEVVVLASPAWPLGGPNGQATSTDPWTSVIEIFSAASRLDCLTSAVTPSTFVWNTGAQSFVPSRRLSPEGLLADQDD